jgi:hypothetical protein
MHDGLCQADIVASRGDIRLDCKNYFHGSEYFTLLLKCNLDFDH